MILPAVLGSPLVVGALGIRRAARTGAGWSTAVLLPALVAGLSMFILWAGNTVFDAGRPYDPGLLRDFGSSGAPDLATYAVSDNLGAAMGLLLLVPVVTVVLAGVGAAVGRSLGARPRGNESNPQPELN